MTSVEALHLLELTPPFTNAELKKAYRQAQMVWHPDRFPGNDDLRTKAVARSALINQAFSEILSAVEAGQTFSTTLSQKVERTKRKPASQEVPQSASDFNLRGISQQAKGRTNCAIADFTEAIRRDPLVAIYYRNRGVAYASKRRLPDAIVDFSRAVHLDPTIDLTPQNAYAYRARAAVARLSGQSENAIADLTEAIRLDPAVADIYRQRGILYKDKGRYDMALLDFNEARRLSPRHHFCFRSDFRKHGKLAESRGDFDQAIADYSEVIQSFRKGTSDHWAELVDDYFCRARVWRLKGEWRNAIADYSEAITLFPTSHLSGWGFCVAAYYKCRAQTYVEMGDISCAISDLTEAMRLDPAGRAAILEGTLRTSGPEPKEEGWIHKQALSTLASLLARTGNVEAAIQSQKRYLRLLDLTETEAVEGRQCLAIYEAHS